MSPPCPALHSKQASKQAAPALHASSRAAPAFFVTKPPPPPSTHVHGCPSQHARTPPHPPCRPSTRRAASCRRAAGRTSWPRCAALRCRAGLPWDECGRPARLARQCLPCIPCPACWVLPQPTLHPPALTHPIRARPTARCARWRPPTAPSLPTPPTRSSSPCAPAPRCPCRCAPGGGRGLLVGAGAGELRRRGHGVHAGARAGGGGACRAVRLPAMPLAPRPPPQVPPPAAHALPLCSHWCHNPQPAGHDGHGAEPWLASAYTHPLHALAVTRPDRLAGHDGHGAEPGPERRGGGGPGRQARRALRLRLLPPPAGHVWRRGAGHRPRGVRGADPRRQGARAAWLAEWFWGWGGVEATEARGVQALHAVRACCAGCRAAPPASCSPFPRCSAACASPSLRPFPPLCPPCHPTTPPSHPTMPPAPGRRRTD